jgi:anti-anti-sigma factor
LRSPTEVIACPCPASSADRPQVDSSFVLRIDLVAGRVELTGTLDHRTAHLISDAVAALVRTGSPQWVLDLAGLTGCNYAGLRAIGAAYRQALRHGRRLTVVGAPPTLRAALARLRLDHHIPARDETPSTADDRAPG